MTVSTSNLTRPTSSGGNQKKYTCSVWLKPSNIRQGSRTILSSDVEDDGSNYASWSFEADGIIKFINVTGGSLVTNYQANDQSLDCTAWMHCVLRIDTANSTSGDRIRLYINNKQVTSWGYSTTPNNNDTGMFKSGTATLIGARHSSSSQNRWEGSMAHMHIVDGQSYAPSVFAETDSATGEWVPKLSPSGITYGTNGAFLKFENSSAMGTDSSGNSNNYTVVGPLRQGVDTPSNNFLKLDPFQAYATNQYGAVTVDFGGTATLGDNGTSMRSCNGTLMAKKGKWYCEFKLTQDAGKLAGMGIQKNGTHASRRFKNEGNNGTPGRETGSNGDEGITYEPLGSSFHIIKNNSGTAYGAQASQNDIFGMAVDLDNGKIWFSRNGTFLNAPGTSNVGNPATGANPGLTFTVGDEYWGIHASATSDGSGNAYTYLNSGQGHFGSTAISSGNSDAGNKGTFEYTVPSGYYAWCTDNIATQG